MYRKLLKSNAVSAASGNKAVTVGHHRLLQGAPYLTREAGTDGQPRYTGYMKDLLDKLMLLLGRKYELYLAPDGQFGHLQPGGVWSGMINELLQAVSALPRVSTELRYHTET